MKINTSADAIDAAIEIVDSTEEISEETAEINAADVKINVADNGKVIEQIKVDINTAISIINRLNYRNDTFVYRHTTRYDNADIKCRHFDAYKADGEKDAFAITEYVINGKLEIVRFFNLFRDITVDMKIGNVNYTIGDKGAIVLTADNTPPDNEPMSDDISDICKYNPDLDDDDKSCRLDWDDSATFIDERTGEEELAAFISPQIVIEEGYLEPVIIDNGKTYTESEYAAKVADADLVTRAENKSARDLTAEERDALFAGWRAQTLSDPAIDAAYQKAKQIVKVDICAGGNRWHVQKKNGEWTLNKPYAMKRLYECGITDTDFIIKARAEKTAFTTRTDKNGKTLYYIDGERTNRDKALDACAKMRGDNHFTIEYQRGRYGDDGKIVYSTERKTMSRIDLKIGTHDNGFSVYFYNGFATVHIFEEYEDAKACFSQIEAAFFAGLAGVKVDSDGKVSDLDEMPDIAAELVAGEKIYMGNSTCTYNVNGEKIHFDNGEWFLIESDKYGVRLFRDYNGSIWDIKNIDGQRRKLDCTEAEFWRAMIERGACTIDLTDAEKLTAKLKEVTRKARLMEIYPQVGGRIVDNLHKVEIALDGGGFIFTNGHETLARYDTKEQCLEVIRQIGVAVEFGDSGFTFPKAADIELELNLPALAAAHLQTYGLTLAESCGYQEAYHA